MDNYYGQYKDQYNNSQRSYTNTYSLWKNSQYYDTNGYASTEWKQSENVPSISTISQYGRVITSETLYEDPQLLGNNVHNIAILINPIQNSTLIGRPQLNWVKAGESSHASEQKPNQNVTHASTRNKFWKTLDKALKKPVKMTKAESMMQKMGWQGGALGKSGDGILEPIAPNAVYATTTAGFGHRFQYKKQKPNKLHSKQQQPTESNKQVKKQTKKQCNKPIARGSQKLFYTNTLQSILIFVRNNLELEMGFDNNLCKFDRRRIHMLVNEVISSDCPKDAKNSDEVQKDLLRQIKHYNCYSLTTESHGEEPNRQLVLYKKAPAHVFLITPDDLKDEKEEGDASAVDVDASTPFLKSTTKNEKEKTLDNLEAGDIEKANQCSLDRIIAYFKEFQGSAEFTEFRFLGPFVCYEIEAINMFRNDMNRCIDGCYSDVVSGDLVKLFKEVSSNYKVNEDVNGSAVIYKVTEERT